MSVVAVWTDDDLFRTVSANMPLEKPLLKLGSTLIRTQHIHELTFILVFLKSRKKVLIIDLSPPQQNFETFVIESRCAR